MRCPQCGAENARDARFCDGCGACLRSTPSAPSETVEERLQRLTPRFFNQEAWSEPELAMLRAALGAEGREAALARGAALDLNQVVAEILACATPEAYWGTGPEGAVAGNDQTKP